MNSLVERNVIKEMQLRENFAYVIENKNDFVLSHYKALQMMKDQICLKCMKMTFNGKIQLFYFTERLVSLADLIPSLDTKNFITVITNILGGIIEITNNGFLPLTNIDVSLDKIFVDQSTFKVEMLFVPTTSGFYSEATTFESTLRTGLNKALQSYTQFKNQQAIDISLMLSDSMISLDQIYKRLRSFSGQPVDDRRSSVRNENHSNKVSSNQYTPSANQIPERNASYSYRGGLTLVSMNSVSRENIIVDTRSVIGKAPSCDAIIDSKIVSKEHCLIFKTDRGYYVKDTESKNGTYINGNRIRPYDEHPLNNGDRLTIANLDYKVEI